MAPAASRKAAMPSASTSCCEGEASGRGAGVILLFKVPGSRCVHRFGSGIPVKTRASGSLVVVINERHDVRQAGLVVLGGIDLDPGSFDGDSVESAMAPDVLLSVTGTGVRM